MYLKEEMERYYYACLKEKPVNRDKYLYYLAEAKKYMDLFEKELAVENITQEELVEMYNKK